MVAEVADARAAHVERRRTLPGLRLRQMASIFAMGRLRIIVLVVLGCGLLAAPRAAAAPDEVIFDPGSPAGKEYAIPLDDARRGAEGAGGAGGAGSSAGPAGRSDIANPPLFGAGVKPERSGGGSSGGPGGSFGRSRADTKAGANAGDPGRGGSGSYESAGSRSNGVSAVEEGLFTIGGAVLVLVLGIAALVAKGFARHRRGAF